jgi:hypothetical protein
MARSTHRRGLPRISVPRVSAPRIRPGSFGGGLGLIVVAVGLLVIGIGWNGAAGSGGEINGVPNLTAQLPWLLSGGILGLGLVVFGAALVIVHNARIDRSRLESKLDELVTTMSRGSGGAIQAPSSAAGLFVAGGVSYHRPDCRLVAGRDDVGYVTADEAAERNLSACRVCRPESVETLAN